VLRNTRELSTKSVKSGLITYYPKITALELRSGDGALQGRYQGNVDLKAGISMTYTIDAKNAAAYDASGGVLGFQKDPSPHESHKADIPWWWFVGGLIVIAVVEIVVKVISDDIAAQVTDDNRERLAMGKHPPSSILWGGSETTHVCDMQVRQALCLTGAV
jgi:hypothetical protein